MESTCHATHSEGKKEKKVGLQEKAEKQFQEND